MVLSYYKVAEQPFGVTPDPRFLFMSRTHREAVASVFHGINAGRGFTASIAEPGMGKTTRPVVTTLQFDDSKVIFIQPKQTLYWISLQYFGYDAETLASFRELNRWLADPRRLNPGQKLRLPDPKSFSRTSHSSAGPITLGTVSRTEKP